MTSSNVLIKDQLWISSGDVGAEGAALRTFYSKAPERDWSLPRKIWTVIGSAVLSWGLIFGGAALLISA